METLLQWIRDEWEQVSRAPIITISAIILAVLGTWWVASEFYGERMATLEQRIAWKDERLDELARTAPAPHDRPDAGPDRPRAARQGEREEGHPDREACSSFMTVSPKQILDDAYNAAPYDRAGILKKYVDGCVRWTLPYLNFHPYEDGGFVFFKADPEDYGASVSARIILDESPDIKLAKKDELLSVEGRIAEVRLGEVDLNDAKIARAQRPTPTLPQ